MGPPDAPDEDEEAEDVLSRIESPYCWLVTPTLSLKIKKFKFKWGKF